MVQIKRSRFQALDGREAGRCGYDEAGGGAAVSRSMNACAWTTIAPGSSPASSRSNMSVAVFAISMTGWRIVGIGRASGRERVCQYGWISVVAGDFEKKTNES